MAKHIADSVQSFSHSFQCGQDKFAEIVPLTCRAIPHVFRIDTMRFLSPEPNFPLSFPTDASRTLFLSDFNFFPPVLLFFAKNLDAEPYDKKDNKSSAASKECHSYNDTNLGPNVEPL